MSSLRPNATTRGSAASLYSISVDAVAEAVLVEDQKYFHDAARITRAAGIDGLNAISLLTTQQRFI